MRDIRRVLQGIRTGQADDQSRTGALSEAPPVRDLGSGVVLYPDSFVVGGQRYRRRTYPSNGRLQPIDRARPRPTDWESQLDSLPSPADLAAEVPGVSEVFGYLSATMAQVLARIARVDASPDGHGFVLLVGPTGCGKTTLAKTYCHLANQPCAELSFSGDTTLTDFYTSVEVVRGSGGQSTVTVPGPAVEAMLRGKKLLLNELNMLSPDILNVFTQAMDTGRLVISGTERGNVEVEVHPQFGLIGTANPGYIGTIQLGRAVERRFGRGLGYVEMDFLSPDEEAASLERELNATSPFHEAGVAFDPRLVRRIAELADRLRHDPQIGEAIAPRLSTRALIHWLGTAWVAGLSLQDVARRAMFALAPSEARNKALDEIAAELDGARPDPAASARLLGHRVAWPTIPPDSAVPTLEVLPRAPRSHADGHVVLHRVRYQEVLSNGTRVLVGEAVHHHGDRRYGLGTRLRIYDRDGRQVTDATRVEAVEGEMRERYGVNVPHATGRRARPSELLPVITPTTLSYLEVAEAALVMARPVFLVGPTGCGKSSLARTVAHLRGARIVELSFTGETAKNDLSASRKLVGGVTRWSVQAFLEALSRGDTVIVNEYNLAYPDVHSLINSLFDKGASVSLPDGSVYRMHADARLIATGYLDGPGVKPLNEGVENRFGAIVAMEYLPVEEEIAVLAAVSPGLGRPALESSVRLIDYCRRLGAGKVETTGIAGLSRASQEALQSAARRAALTTAELVALARTSAGDGEFLARLRTGLLEGASDTARRVLEPVLLQYQV